MKKIYIAPKIDVIILDSLCDATLQTASVYQDRECIDQFKVVDEEKTRTEYKGLWGKSNSNNWGDD